MTSLPPSRSDPSKAINTSPTWDLWQFCQVCRPGNTALWPRPSPYRWPPGETLGACPQGNGDGTRPKGLGHPAEGQGVNCPPLSPSRLRSSSGVEGLNQIFLSPPCLSFDGFPEDQNKISNTRLALADRQQWADLDKTILNLKAKVLQGLGLTKTRFQQISKNFDQKPTDLYIEFATRTKKFDQNFSRGQLK